jgi:hypothetical protein
LAGAPLFSTDGALRDHTITSTLDDGELHELPGDSSYAWRWGGSGAFELTIAVLGTVDLVIGEVSRRLEGEGERFGLHRLVYPRGADMLEVHAVGERAAVTDLWVVARPS